MLNLFIASNNLKINLKIQNQPKFKNILEFRSTIIGYGNTKEHLSGTPLIE
jgi:hypothetical protein